MKIIKLLPVTAFLLACGGFLSVSCGPSECAFDAACNDGDPCTADACVNGQCVNIPIADCGNENVNGNQNENVNVNENQNINENINENDNLNENVNENLNENENENVNENENLNENGTPSSSAGNLFVSTATGDASDFSRINEFDGDTGQFIKQVLTHTEAGSNQHFTFGADGNLYSSLNNEVLRFNGDTGELLGTFVSSGSGGLTSATSLEFGADGDLYVINADSEILKYEGSTGAFLNVFIEAGSGGLEAPLVLRFGPSDNLFVLNFIDATNEVSVLEYDGTGAPVREFVSPGSGGVLTAVDMAFGPTGNLYIPDGAGNVQEFNGSTGAPMGTFFSGQATLTFPTALVFGPDDDLYMLASVGADQTAAVVHVDGTTKVIEDTFFSSEMEIFGYLAFKP